MLSIPNKPAMQKADVIKLLAPFALVGYTVKLLGVRGYFKHTMGNPASNDIGLYDDAIFVVSPTVFAAFNANVDPSKETVTMAHLKPGGPYLYKIGMHNMQHPYEALRQYGRLTVLRDGKEETDTAEDPFYIDIHKGGYNTTSSLGCQTVPPEQWKNFLYLVKAELKLHNQTIIPYCLVEA